MIADVKTISLGNKSFLKPGYGGDKAFGETFDGAKKLLDNLAESSPSRVQSQGLRSGSPEASKELVLVISYLRRHLSSAVHDGWRGARTSWKE